MRLLRLALQAVLFFLLLGAVIGIGSGETGAVEKLVVAVVAGLLICVAARLRRIGAPPAPRSSQ
ncbi:MAG TPA: hypothetical protein VKA57_14960 [Solirubrobacteraceae bacterium]|nr:hypothetical protein [Solirubrobacteraceae bacterium]